jgi:hypothetical protein
MNKSSSESGNKNQNRKLATRMSIEKEIDVQDESCSRSFEEKSEQPGRNRARNVNDYRMPIKNKSNIRVPRRRKVVRSPEITRRATVTLELEREAQS